MSQETPTAPGKEVQFPHQIGRAPGARIPGGGTPNRLSAQQKTAPDIQFLALRADASLPALGTPLAAGYDLATPEAISFKPGERKRIPLGFALALPEDLHARIESRSGLALKGLVVLTGVIDADYRGELAVIMQNFSTETYDFAAGDRVAQLVLRPTVHRYFRPVGELDATQRGGGGFGSTGA